MNASEVALLVMDYQPGILHQLPDADALLARAAQAIEAVRRRGGHVGYVRVAFDEADVRAMPAANKMHARVSSAGANFTSDSPMTQVHERVAPQAADIVVRKTRIGAFSTTDLHERLRERGVTTLILAGVSTSGVVLSTVRDGGDRDYGLFVLSDACADPDAAVHEFLVEKIFPRQADVLTVAEIGRAFGVTA